MAFFTIPAGELDQLVSLQQRVAGTDAYGQDATTWADVSGAAGLWARVRPLTGRDYQAAGAPQSAASIRVELRAGVTVDDTMRITWQGQPWDIVGKPLVVDKAWLRFDAVAGVRDGR